MNSDLELTASDGLRLAVTTFAESPVFRTFWEGYDKAFVLPDEKEYEAGFRECLALNHGVAYRDLAMRYGPFREVCVVVRDGETVIGGANFIAMPIRDLVTANLNYVYVDPASRGRGYLRRSIAAFSELITGLFSSAAKPLFFLEQNDPFAMSEEAYRRDTAQTGLDQIARLTIWAKLGARVVDFAYVQPALAPGRKADHTLLYSVLGEGQNALPACLLEAHLRRFFGISVLKGLSIESDADAVQQLKWLTSACRRDAAIRLIDPTPLLLQLVSEGGTARPERNLRAALASLP